MDWPRGFVALDPPILNVVILLVRTWILLQGWWYSSIWLDRFHRVRFVIIIIPGVVRPDVEKGLLGFDNTPAFRHWLEVVGLDHLCQPNLTSLHVDDWSIRNKCRWAVWDTVFSLVELRSIIFYIILLGYNLLKVLWLRVDNTVVRTSHADLSWGADEASWVLESKRTLVRSERGEALQHGFIAVILSVSWRHIDVEDSGCISRIVYRHLQLLCNCLSFHLSYLMLVVSLELLSHLATDLGIIRR